MKYLILAVIFAGSSIGYSKTPAECVAKIFGAKSVIVKPDSSLDPTSSLSCSQKTLDSIVLGDPLLVSWDTTKHLNPIRKFFTGADEGAYQQGLNQAQNYYRCEDGPKRDVTDEIKREFKKLGLTDVVFQNANTTLADYNKEKDSPDFGKPTMTIDSQTHTLYINALVPPDTSVCATQTNVDGILSQLKFLADRSGAVSSRGTAPNPAPIDSGQH